MDDPKWAPLTYFATNLETGLKPLLAGFRIREVPVSWINRRADMGTSSFRTLRVGPPYVRSLGRSMRLWRSLASHLTERK